MKIQELGVEEMARHGATHRVIITFEDINGTGTGHGALSAAAAASTTGTLIPFNDLPAGNVAQFIAGYLKTAFDGTSTTQLTLTAGYNLASGTDKAAGFLAATQLHNDATEVVFFPIEIADVDIGASDATYGAEELAVLQAAVTAINTLIKSTRKVFGVASDVELLFTATTANLTDLLSGEVHLLFRVVDLTKI